MESVIAGGTGCTNSQAPTLHVGTYRRALLRIIIGSPLFTDAEQLRANHNAHECQDATRLALWTKNARRVADEREAADLARTEQTPAPTPLPAAAPTLADLANPAYVAANQGRPAGCGLTVGQAAEGLANLGASLARAQARGLAPTPAPCSTPYATPAQCEEVGRLTNLRYFTAGERAHELRRLPQLTSAEAVWTIGSLYATALRRSTVRVFSDGGQGADSTRRG